jgi:hypothetical protein
MKTQIIVDEAAVLENGKVIVAVTNIVGKPLAATMVGRTPSGDIEVEVVSVALVNSPPATPNKQGLHVRLLKGTAEALKGATINFD